MSASRMRLLVLLLLLCSCCDLRAVGCNAAASAGRQRPHSAPRSYASRTTGLFKRVDVVESTNPFEDFKNSLFHTIVKHRIYELQKLHILFDEYRRVNSEEHRRALEDAIDCVKDELSIV